MPNLRVPQIVDSVAPVLSGATAETKAVLSEIRNSNRHILLGALRTKSAVTEPENLAGIMGGRKSWATAYDVQEGFDWLTAKISADYATGSQIMLHDHMPNPVTWSGWGSYSQAAGSAPASNGVYDMSQGAAALTACLAGGAQRARWLAYLDGLCTFFNSLVDSGGKKIPVIFRPLHEQVGKWFWWHGSATLVSLWQDYVARLQYNGVTNVIMVWCTTVNSVGGTLFNYTDYLALYPGDAYCDVIGCDIYSNAVGGSLRHGWVASGWAGNVQLAGERNKPLIIPEMGFQASATDWSATNEDLWTAVILPYIKSNLYQARALMFWSPPFGPTTSSPQNSAGAAQAMQDPIWITR